MLSSMKRPAIKPFWPSWLLLRQIKTIRNLSRNAHGSLSRYMFTAPTHRNKLCGRISPWASQQLFRSDAGRDWWAEEFESPSCSCIKVIWRSWHSVCVEALAKVSSIVSKPSPHKSVFSWVYCGFLPQICPLISSGTCHPRCWARIYWLKQSLPLRVLVSFTSKPSK